MKLSNLGYLFKEGIRGIFLHGFMSFAAVVVTHEMNLVQQFGNRVISINEGLVVSDGMEGYRHYEE